MKLLNAFSVNMLPRGLVTRVQFEPVTENKAAEMAEFFPPESCVGHADTANLFSRVLGQTVPMNRVSVSLETREIALLGQYSGPRLPEGATSLPDGAKIDWYLITVD